MIKGQGFAQEHVVESTRRIDANFEPRLFSTSKLVNAVGDNIRWLPELVGDDRLEQLRVNPQNCFRRTQGGFDVGNADFVVFEIVGKTSRADPFVARDPQVIEADGAVAKTNAGGGRAHDGAAKSCPLQLNRSLAGPFLGVRILAVDLELNSGRSLPFPLTEKFVQFG